MSDQSTVNDPFEMLRRMWAQAGLPLGGMSVPGIPFPGLPLPAMALPTFNVEELEKRISDLKTVENWLTLNLNVLKMTIQGLEMQKSTLHALKAMRPTVSSTTTAEGALQSAAEAWWNMFQQVTSPGTRPENEEK